MDQRYRWSGGSAPFVWGGSVSPGEGAQLDHDSLIPLPRVSPESGPVRVVGVESEPLTAEQETAAVRALSRLIATWLTNRPTPELSTAEDPGTRIA